MTSPKIDYTMHFLRLNWPIIATVCAGLIAWGTAMADINALKEAAAKKESDHDRIIKVETVVESSGKVIAEIRTEQKEASKEMQRLEISMNSNFQTLLLELQKERP